MSAFFNIHLLIVMITFIFVNHSYYLNQQELTWDQAQTYCESHCNSQLASIHDITQNELAIHIMKYSTEWNVFDGDGEVWIGLYDSNPTIGQLQWSDGTTVDYGASMSQYPWHPNPSLFSSTQTCTKFAIQSQDYFWEDDDCATTHMSLCNACDSQFNKFAITPGEKQWKGFDGDGDCARYFGTFWNSIHSQEDYDNAVLISTLFDSNKLWIGLNDRAVNGVYTWPDGTTLDFAGTTVPTGVYPWTWSEPSHGTSFGATEECVLIEATGLLNDYYCTHMLAPQRHHQLCNAPSDICYPEHWEQVIPDSPIIQWQSTPCYLVLSALMGDTLLVLKDKQWLNNGNMLRIHYMLNIHSGDNGDAGIVIDFVNKTRYYAAGIAITDTNPRLFIAQMEDDQYNELANIPIVFTMHTYYPMEVSVSYDSTFTVSMNGYSVSYQDTTRDNTPFSGYIGVHNIGLETHVKSLFVSGTELSTLGDFDLNCLCIVTTTTNPTVKTPTKAPTKTPTYTPTNIPSTSPSDEPSTPPSQAPIGPPSKTPTDPPSKTQTDPPSKTPTDPPSKTPTNPPSKISTDPPSKIPTDHPSKTPTDPPSKTPTDPPSKTPTHIPSWMPSVLPSNNPTDSIITTDVATSGAVSNTDATEDDHMNKENTDHSAVSDDRLVTIAIISSVGFVTLLICVLWYCRNQKIRRQLKFMEEVTQIVHMQPQSTDAVTSPNMTTTSPPSVAIGDTAAPVVPSSIPMPGIVLSGPGALPNDEDASDHETDDRKEDETDDGTDNDSMYEQEGGDLDGDTKGNTVDVTTLKAFAAAVGISIDKFIAGGFKEPQQIVEMVEKGKSNLFLNAGILTVWEVHCLTEYVENNCIHSNEKQEGVGETVFQLIETRKPTVN